MQYTFVRKFLPVDFESTLYNSGALLSHWTMERSQMWFTLFSLKWHKIKCLGERKQAIKKVTAETKMEKIIGP